VGKRKKNNNEDEYYFGDSVEKAVRVYIDPATTQGEKNRIFSEVLYEPLQELVRSIIGRYPKYVGVIGLEELEQQAFIAVYENMHKFKPDRKTKAGKEPKAYSYYGTICRNYIKTHSQKSYKLESNQDMFETFNDSFEANHNFTYNIEDKPYDSIYSNILSDVANTIYKEIATNISLKTNDVKVGQVLIMIVENWSTIYGEEDKKLTPFFLKKKIYQLITELSGLTAKEVKNSVKAYQKVYSGLLQILIEEDN
jgi:hypothetical protein